MPKKIEARLKWDSKYTFIHAQTHTSSKMKCKKFDVVQKRNEPNLDQPIFIGTDA